MYSLNSTTKRNIESCLSLAFSDLVAMDYNDEFSLLKPLDGKKIVFPTKIDPRKIDRGNPFLARKRFKTIEEVDQRLMEVCNADIKRSF